MYVQFGALFIGWLITVSHLIWGFFVQCLNDLYTFYSCVYMYIC